MVWSSCWQNRSEEYPGELLLPLKPLPDLLPALQQKVKDQRQQEGDADNGEVLPPIAGGAVTGICNDTQDECVCRQRQRQDDMSFKLSHDDVKR